MKKEERRRRMHEAARSRAEAKPLPGMWIIEYECGLRVNFPPANQDDIIHRVNEKKHYCKRAKCRAWRYTRVEQEE